MNQKTVRGRLEATGQRYYQVVYLLGVCVVAVFSGGCALEGSGEIEDRDFLVETFDEVIISAVDFTPLSSRAKRMR